MSLPDFAQKGQIIVIEASDNSVFDGAWKVYGSKENPGQPEAPLLLLESMYRSNQAYTTKAFDPKTMRAITDADITHQDSFLPVGTHISVEDPTSSVKSGLWNVDKIISGTTLEDARICFKKDGAPLSYMSGKFNASTMKVVKTATPKMAVFAKPAALT